MTYVTAPKPHPGNSILLQTLFALAMGLAIFLLASVAISGGVQAAYLGRIFPGVSVAGVDLSGMTPQEAALSLNNHLSYPYSGQIVFRDGDQVWVARPGELGLVFDPGGSAQSAYRMGRSGGIFRSLAGQVNAWQSGVDLPPVLIFDQRVAYAYLQNLASEIDLPVIEAHLGIDGTQVVAIPGQVGRSLNVDLTMLQLVAQLQSFKDGEVPLVIEATPPQILDASQQAAQAQVILSAPLTLTMPNPEPGDPGPWTVGVESLAGMLRIERIENGSEAAYQLVMDTQSLAPLMSEILAAIVREAKNARFIFNDETLELELLQGAVTGRVLDSEATLASIQQKLLQGEHNVPLEIVTIQPAVGDDAVGRDLGITEKVAEAYTYFRGSSTERIQNIRAASSEFLGLLVAPGETFSMASAMRDISLENGYAEALIIYGGQTIKGVGGGVCQVSTTLFRTAFFGGFPIEERYSHAYRVKYYEQSTKGYDTSMAGLDATVYVPVVDLKFTNDSPYWLLIEAWVYPKDSLLLFKFYSTSDGRTVEWGTTGLQNLVPAPPPEFKENPELAAGEMRQVDWAADGATVTITRAVRRNGEVVETRQFITRYQPWQAVCEYGPGTEDPEGLAASKGYCQP